MTLAFTFRIKDAWVVVADKKAITQDDNIKDAYSRTIKFFSDNRQKIEEIAHELIFIGAGNRAILDKAIESINLSNNFEEFLKFLNIKITSIYSEFGEKIQREEFLIIQKNTQKAFKFEIKKLKVSEGKKGFYELKPLKFENNFIGCYENSINLGSVKLKFFNLKENMFNQIGKRFYKKCNNFLEILSIDNLYSVGHPAIHGSDIWIISKDKIKKIYLYAENKYRLEIKDD